MRRSRLSDSWDSVNDEEYDRSGPPSPGLQMPPSPDAAPHMRASKPRLRVHHQSDAAVRAKTPRQRLNQRSMTSDAGTFKRQARNESSLWGTAIQPVITYLLDVLGLALHYAKPVLGYAILLYLLITGFAFAAGFLTKSVNTALAPICHFPGVSHLHLPFCPQTLRHGPAEFDKLVETQTQFEDILASTQVGATLPMDMKRSEAGIRDLKHVVQYSILPSRNELVFEFTAFIDTARQASHDLGTFNSRIGRAVDHIVSTSKWTLSVIDDYKTKQLSRGAVARWSDSINPFAPATESTILDQYLRHTSAVEDQITSLITEAQALLGMLDHLDSRLDDIANIATRDGVRVKESKEELFALLWTKLGGNRSQKAKFAEQIDLLNQVGAYKRLAWAHITTTIVKLQAMRDGLEDLRERVAMPEVLGDKVPLEVHIEHVTRGIERLERQRDAGRKAELEGYRRVLEQAERGGREGIGESTVSFCQEGWVLLCGPTRPLTFEFLGGAEDEPPADNETPKQEYSEPAKSHSLDSLLALLIDSRVAYTSVLLGEGDLPLLKRELFDIKTSLLQSGSENDELIDKISHSDLAPGVYEGGFKTWECSVDLARHLEERGPRRSLDDLWRVGVIVELGCGSALPTSVLFRYAVLHKIPIHFVLADYNSQVLQAVTLPNLILNWWAACAADRGVGGEGDEADDLLLSESLLSAFTSALHNSNITLSFLSGPWSPDLRSLLPSFPSEASTLILGAETIYTAATTDAFVEMLEFCLKEGNLAKALVAAKKYYFGLGGSVDLLKTKCAQKGLVAAEAGGMDKGVGRGLIEVQRF
ncbi:hypothetical protein K470DRAFT_263139 [Piedraia hortae CBS 480.64]|uniref:protein-histidine N-methyltransferase n=1 Tax=Piedraia hortae CBS 480.64 TaxID=1314780 RepID=A0A6A7C3G8_9PEZI|nr:hypothetical protein K470DRAFT_263139 [Piedraia hortae CBS 480.64]